MIIERKGNCLDVPNGVLVHGCNSHGVMGSGIAKEVKARFPGAFKVYVDAYVEATNIGLPGLPLGTFTDYEITPTKVIVNAVTQQDYGREPGHVYVDYVALGQAFQRIADDPYLMSIMSIHGIHFPLIGCGLANGDWNVVGALIDNIIPDHVEKTLWIFQP